MKFNFSVQTGRYNKVTQKDFNKDLDGIEFLRHLVNCFNFRHEYLNADKTPQQLINEYVKILNEEIDIYGDDITDN